MTQFPSSQFEMYGDEAGQPRKTSGLSITALVLSLVGLCCGCTAPIGVLLGIIAFATTGPRSPKKGRGMAVAAIIVGLILSLLWGGFAYWASSKYYEMLQLPDTALRAGFAGDIATFKSKFHGAGATAPDAEAEAFISELRSRYGNFVSATVDQSGPPPKQSPGQPIVPLPFQFTFDNATLSGEVEFIILDEQSSELVLKMGTITINDPNSTSLVYPASAVIGGGATTAQGPGGASP